MSGQRYGSGDRVRVVAETSNLGRRVLPQYKLVLAGSIGVVDYYSSGRVGETLVTLRLDAGPPGDGSGATARTRSGAEWAPGKPRRCFAGESDLGTGTLDDIDVAIDRLCRDYPTMVPSQLRTRGMAHMRYVLRLVEGRTTLDEHRELLVRAGWLGALLACVHYDLGDRTAAEAARRTTRRLGEQAGHGEIIAWSWEIAAWMALTEGRYHDVVSLAEAGLRHAGASSVAVQLTLQAGRGYARMGDRQAVEALKVGQKILDRLPRPDHPEHHFVFDPGKHEFYVTTILTWLGTDDDTAEDHAREVLARCQRPGEAMRWPMRAAYASIDLGLIAGRRRALDEAIHHGQFALALERRSADLMPRAVELYGDLKGRYPQERSVAEYGEILKEKQRMSLP
jgi:hypothetical protein